MAELGQDMDVDHPPVVPPRKSEPPQLWDMSKLGETIAASWSQLLDPIRRVVREELEVALNREQRPVSKVVLGRGPTTRSLSTATRLQR